VTTKSKQMGTHLLSLLSSTFLRKIHSFLQGLRTM